MTEIFKYYARCNMQINQTMIDIIMKSDKKPYNTSIPGYYKSIGEILDHNFTADINWLNTFKQVRNSDIFKNPLFDKIPQWGERQFSEIEKFAEKRKELDSIIITFIDEITEEDLHKEIIRTTKTGERIARIVWKAMMHTFNHGTHHRGQISQILDSLEIENDYSNMVRIE